ncbi:hypothetical protein X977_1524 [Burkholderia pseudomallei MSHR7504]|nr:hypothetical protein X977_1524 [Burkholderia pseudomallei MSHR7504]
MHSYRARRRHARPRRACLLPAFFRRARPRYARSQRTGSSRVLCRRVRSRPRARNEHIFGARVRHARACRSSAPETPATASCERVGHNVRRACRGARSRDPSISPRAALRSGACARVCDPRRARPWPHAGNMLVRGMRVATCACARCVFPQAMHVSAARAAITTPAALRAKRHASRTSNAPVGCPDSIRLDPALFGSIRLYSARIKSTRIEPAAHAAGSRRSSIPHHSPHASATAPRIAPPAAVNPHRNCGDTRPDSSPRCA